MTIEIYHYDDYKSLEPGIIKHIEERPYRTLLWTLLPQEPPIPEVVEILKFFRSKLHDENWAFFQWIVVAERGGSLQRHNHTADWAGVYHVEGHGDLVFDNDDGKERRVPVVPGQLVVWPADVFHWVDEVKSDRRISVGLHAMIVR